MNKLKVVRVAVSRNVRQYSSVLIGVPDKLDTTGDMMEAYLEVAIQAAEKQRAWRWENTDCFSEILIDDWGET
jgi:hypothetical protein